MKSIDRKNRRLDNQLKTAEQDKDMTRCHRPSGQEFRDFHNARPGTGQERTAWQFSDFTYEVNGSREIEIEDLRRVYGARLEGLPGDAVIAIRAEFLEAFQFLVFKRDFGTWKAGCAQSQEPRQSALSP